MKKALFTAFTGLSVILIIALIMRVLSGKPILPSYYDADYIHELDRAEGSKVINNIKYVKDDRTGLCFAYIQMGKDIEVSEIGITVVPCDCIPDSLLILIKEASSPDEKDSPDTSDNVEIIIVDGVKYYAANVTVELKPWEFRKVAERRALARIAHHMYSNSVAIQHALNGALDYKCKFTESRQTGNGTRIVTATVMVRVS